MAYGKITKNRFEKLVNDMEALKKYKRLYQKVTAPLKPLPVFVVQAEGPNGEKVVAISDNQSLLEHYATMAGTPAQPFVLVPPEIWAKMQENA